VIHSQNYIIVVHSQASIHLCLIILLLPVVSNKFANQGCAKALWGNLVWGCLVVLGVAQGAQRIYSSCRSTTPVCIALPHLPGTIGQVFQCLWLRQVGSSQLMQVWCVSMCWFFVFDPLEFCYGTPIRVSCILVQLSLQAAPEIREHRHNIIFYAFLSHDVRVCTYSHVSACMSEFF
jgi:hypothetical protein